MNRIIIEVSGGCITQVTAVDEQVEVIIIDYDCQDANDTVEIPNEGQAMVERYTDTPEKLSNRAQGIIDAVTAHENKENSEEDSQ